MKRIIIGEGSYGCVHKPSIHCKVEPKPNFDYKKYVSKIMKTKNAEKELEEFVTIQRIDPNDEYHLGKPILCKPNLNEPGVKEDIKKCRHIKLDDIEEKPNDYSLLVLKFGGVDLKILCNKYLKKYLEKDKEIRSDKFWLEVHHLIKGLKFFKDNGIIHNDIKPQNILFDSLNGKMKYIDFGLMRTKKEVMDSSKSNNNYLGIYHWSYPFDCGLMNKKQFINYKDQKQVGRVNWKNSLSELIVTNSKSNPLNLPIYNPESFSILFSYLNPDNTIPNVSTQYGYINSFFDGFNNMIERDNYDKVLNYITDSIDVFGLGFTLQFMANCFKRLNAISLEDFTRLSSFFSKMWDFNPMNRVININNLLNEYENILLEIGILTRLEKSFENNKLINKPPAPPVIMTEAKIEEKSGSQNLSATLQEFANKDPIIISLKGLKNKEIPPLTKKYVTRCKNGYESDYKFGCSDTKKTRKIKTFRTKSFRTKSVKICFSDKELNPKTNRCVKKCQNGYLRNKKFQCRNASKTIKRSLMNLSITQSKK